jgi:hypothetical protein
MQASDPNIQLNPVTLATAVYNFFVYGETVYAYRVVQVIVSISLYVLAYKMAAAIYKHVGSGGTLACLAQGRTLDEGACGEPISLFRSVVVYMEALQVATYVPVTAIVASWFFRLMHNMLVYMAKYLASQDTKSLHGTRKRYNGGVTRTQYSGGSK